MTLKELRGTVKTGKNAEVVSFINSLHSSTLKMFLKQHRDWYINDRFLRGDHWVVYNKTLNKVQTIPISDGEVRRTINKIRAQVRGVKNFIKKSQPRWECHPEDTTDEAYEEARKKNKILQNIYRTRNVVTKLTDVISNSLKYSLGILEGGVITRDGEPYLDFWVDSTYDVVFDPYVNDIQAGRFAIKATPVPVESIIENKNYKVEEKSFSDNIESASTYKEVLEREKFAKDANKVGEDLQTAIVKELWIKWYDEKGIHVRVITIAGNNVLKVKDTNYKRYPFFGYNPERSADSLYSDPWIKDLISANKSLDKTVSQIETYISRMLAGKYLIKQGTEVTTITDKGAEYIYYNGQHAPVQQNLQPLPAAPFTHVMNMERYIEELGGVREASLGRAPGSLQSGKAVEALQVADASTVAEPIENLEVFLQGVGEFILEILSEYTLAAETIIEDKDKISFGGKNVPKTEGLIQIGPKNSVKVVIVPEVAYSEEAKKDWLLKFAEMELIDPETVLEQFNFSNIGDILERMKVRKEEQYKEEMMKQRESHRTDGNGPEDSSDLANQENMQMAAGQDVPMTPRALWVPEHTELHMAFINENIDAYQQNKELYDMHIQQEQQYGNK